MHKRAGFGRWHASEGKTVRSAARRADLLHAGPHHGRHRPGIADLPVHGFTAAFHARDTGLVQIQIRSPLDTGPGLERLIRPQYKVDVHVVPVPDTLNETEVLDRVAIQAARTIGPLVDSNAVIGVAWGSTLSSVSRHLARKTTHDSVIVQLNGAGNMQTTGITTPARSSAASATLTAPGWSSSRCRHSSTRPRPSNDVGRAQRAPHPGPAVPDDHRDLRPGHRRCRLPSHVYAGGYLDQETWIRWRPRTSWATWPRSSSGPTARRRGIAEWTFQRPGAGPAAQRPPPVCVVSGPSKINGLRGALAAGLVTDLILDEASARRLVSFEAGV